MTSASRRITFLPCLDSPELSQQRRLELDIPWQVAAARARSAVDAAEQGFYLNQDGVKVDWSLLVSKACAGKQSIRPDDRLPIGDHDRIPETRVQVTNETTLLAGRRLTEAGLRPLALNFANGSNPGGGFLGGARAQEEAICRSSALFHTLLDDPMYDAHRETDAARASDWVIYSPDVPVFRGDDGGELDRPWCLSFLTCAAPYAPDIGQPEAGDLLRRRIDRVLDVARALKYSALILGAWGCGAFANDPHRTAADFRQAIESDSGDAFSDVVFAISDWSPQRKFLGPFRDVFRA